MVTNTISPFGFRPFGRREGGAPTAGLERAFINSSDTNTYFTGDVVYLSSSPAGAGGFNFPNTISLSSQGKIPLGVFQGCKYYSPTVGRTVWNSYFPGSIGSSNVCEAYVITDPNQLFVAQASTTSGVVGTSIIGYSISVASSGQTSGNTTTGQSVEALASSGASLLASSAAYPFGPLAAFKVVDVYANVAPPGVNGTSSGAEGGMYLIVQPGNWSRNVLVAAST